MSETSTPAVTAAAEALHPAVLLLPYYFLQRGHMHLFEITRTLRSEADADGELAVAPEMLLSRPRFTAPLLIQFAILLVLLDDEYQTPSSSQAYRMQLLYDALTYPSRQWEKGEVCLDLSEAAFRRYLTSRLTTVDGGGAPQLGAEVEPLLAAVRRLAAYIADPDWLAKEWRQVLADADTGSAAIPYPRGRKRLRDLVATNDLHRYLPETAFSIMQAHRRRPVLCSPSRLLRQDGAGSAQAAALEAFGEDQFLWLLDSRGDMVTGPAAQAARQLARIPEATELLNGAEAMMQQVAALERFLDGLGTLELAADGVGAPRGASLSPAVLAANLDLLGASPAWEVVDRDRHELAAVLQDPDAVALIGEDPKRLRPELRKQAAAHKSLLTTLDQYTEMLDDRMAELLPACAAAIGVAVLSDAGHPSIGKPPGLADRLCRGAELLRQAGHGGMGRWSERQELTALIGRSPVLEEALEKARCLPDEVVDVRREAVAEAALRRLSDLADGIDKDAAAQAQKLVVQFWAVWEERLEAMIANGTRHFPVCDIDLAGRQEAAALTPDLARMSAAAWSDLLQRSLEGLLAEIDAVADSTPPEAARSGRQVPAWLSVPAAMLLGWEPEILALREVLRRQVDSRNWTKPIRDWAAWVDRHAARLSQTPRAAQPESRIVILVGDSTAGRLAEWGPSRRHSVIAFAAAAPSGKSLAEIRRRWRGLLARVNREAGPQLVRRGTLRRFWPFRAAVPGRRQLSGEGSDHLDATLRPIERGIAGQRARAMRGAIVLLDAQTGDVTPREARRMANELLQDLRPPSPTVFAIGERPVPGAETLPANVGIDQAVSESNNRARLRTNRE